MNQEKRCLFISSPNRDVHSKEDFIKINMEWVKVKGGEHAFASVIHNKSYQGDSSLQLSLEQEGECVYELKVDNFREILPVFTYPKIEMQIFPGKNIGKGGKVFFKFTLSQQPPDFESPEMMYVLGEELESVESRDKITVINKRWEEDTWNSLKIDVAKEIQKLKIKGGLDNLIHCFQIGLISEGQPVTACFDKLILNTEIIGTEGLNRQKQLVESLSSEVTHYVGMEFSYYGQHINCFGSKVPVPDYESLLPHRLTSHDIVKHIKKHGGLASINHINVNNLDKKVKELVKNKVYGAHLMEINNKGGKFFDRLRLWDRLAEEGFIVTAVTGTDCHDISNERAYSKNSPSDWVNHIWAKSKDESDLLESLKNGYLYLSNPHHYNGNIKIQGPKNTKMGDVFIASDYGDVSVKVEVTGLEEEDIILWLVNGSIFHAFSTTDNIYYEKLQLPFSIEKNLKALRIQIVRPKLVESEYNGLIAVTNPLYLTNTDLDNLT